MAKVCSVCGAPVGDDAAILTIAGFGSARRLCEGCSELIDKATGSLDYGEVAASAEELAERLAANNCEDGAVLTEMSEIFDISKTRAEKIKLGEDPDADAEDSSEEEAPEIPEELLESEEDRLLDEKEAEEGKKIDKITSWVCGGVFAAVIIYFLLDFVINLF